MPTYNLGSALLLDSIPLGGGPSVSSYTLTVGNPPVSGVVDNVRAQVDGLDPNGDTYYDGGSSFAGGTVTPVDPGSVIRIGSATYTVVNVWHSTGTTDTTGGTLGGGIHIFQITDGTTTLYLAFPNSMASLIDANDVLSFTGNGIVSWFDAGHGASGFSSIIPNYLGGNQGTLVCFAAGTRILTAAGEVAVERLAPGQRIATLAHGRMPLCWVGRVWAGRARLARAEGWRPWRVEAGALGGGLPRRPLRLSGQHRLVVAGAEVARLAGVPVALVAVKHLAALPGIGRDDAPEEVEYFHLLFDRHVAVAAEGAWAESLWPGAMAAGAVAAAAGAVPAALRDGVLAGGPALPMLDGRAGRLLARRLAARRLPAVCPAALAGATAAAA